MKMPSAACSTAEARRARSAAEADRSVTSRWDSMTPVTVRCESMSGVTTSSASLRCPSRWRLTTVTHQRRPPRPARLDGAPERCPEGRVVATAVDRARIAPGEGAWVVAVDLLHSRVRVLDPPVAVEDEDRVADLLERRNQATPLGLAGDP